MPDSSLSWKLFKADPDSALRPADLTASQCVGTISDFGTVASVVASDIDLLGPVPLEIDEYDWWYQCDVRVPDDKLANKVLEFNGISTIAEVWIDDNSVLQSQNMFVKSQVDVSAYSGRNVTISVRCRSLAVELRKKRARPRWKTNLVSQQNLRWLRTTLLGRIPGWTATVAPVGLWRPVKLASAALVNRAQCITGIVDDSRSTVHVRLRYESNTKIPDTIYADLTICGASYRLECEIDEYGLAIDCHVDIPGVKRWWPHTHGSPTLHDFQISIQSENDELSSIDGRVGFRSVVVQDQDSSPQLLINDLTIFCRGACWTIADLISMTGDSKDLRRSLELAVESGANMIRVGGTMTYESDLFYEICDELGLMVWQDFMFANMDYPFADDEFRNHVAIEVEQQVDRLTQHPCITVLCGNSEVEQQAAMYGFERDTWANPLFYDLIPDALESAQVRLPYFPSSPTGGALPFHNRSGISHYFGVGAYRRSVADASRAGVRFATECLGFSNMPSNDTLDRHFKSTLHFTQSSNWKAGIPRDSWTSWDFEDVRNHYVQELFGVDAADLRFSEPERYLAVSKVVSGEIIARVFDQWRQPENRCNGALIWLMKDILPGAGWGYIDSDNRKKPLFYFLKRAWASHRLILVDRGLDGVEGLVLNETETEIRGKIRIQILQHSRAVLADESLEFELKPRSSLKLSLDEILGRFFDTTYSYRFGPPKHDVIAVSLIAHDGELICTESIFPNGNSIRQLDGLSIDAQLTSVASGMELTIESADFLQNIELLSKNVEFSDNYFHLAPGIKKRVSVDKLGDAEGRLLVTITALNSTGSILIR